MNVEATTTENLEIEPWFPSRVASERALLGDQAVIVSLSIKHNKPTIGLYWI